jgi:hypothetical protein
MTEARLLRRHRAYFKGWAQAFGHHDLLRDHRQGLRWLLGETQLGLMLDPSVRTRLRGGDDDGLGGLLADAPHAHALEPATPRPTPWHGRLPTPPALVDVGTETLRLGRLTLRQCPPAVMKRIRALLGAHAELHLFEAYHLLYPSGARILAIGQQPPLGLIYRELTPALMRSAPVATPSPAPLHKAACA